jgi:hypothetical protein
MTAEASLRAASGASASVFGMRPMAASTREPALPSTQFPLNPLEIASVVERSTYGISNFIGLADMLTLFPCMEES